LLSFHFFLLLMSMTSNKLYRESTDDDLPT
jgi:hypothetical protein